jgi:hypothetical protein
MRSRRGRQARQRGFCLGAGELHHRDRRGRGRRPRHQRHGAEADSTHVVVDIGTKSEGMLPLSEVLDHEGKPKVKPGDEIEVMREKGQTEEGYVNLSHQKAARMHAWDEVEKAHHEKRPIQAVVIERTKGGLTVDILGAYGRFCRARKWICGPSGILTA